VAVACLRRSRHSPLIRRRPRCRPASTFRSSGPNLPPMACATFGAPLGLSILGTLDDRVGDTYEPVGCAVAPAVASAAAESPAVDLPTRKPAAVPTKKPGPAPCPLFSPSVWGRFLANQSTTTTAPSPIRVPMEISAASRAASIFCGDL
jgi:hypothetical protein